MATVFVTAGAAHARFLAAELFVAAGRLAILPEPCPPEIRALFAQRLGARTSSGGLLELSPGEPAVVLLAAAETEIAPLLAIAERRPLVVLVDDTWEDLERPSRSPFWSLAGRHPNLIPIKLDGAVKGPAKPAPALGEHGREILESLGYARERIEALVRDGVVRT